MYGQSELSGTAPAPQLSLAGEWLTTGKILLVSSVLLVISICVMAFQYAKADELVLPTGTPIGGDYVAFYAASKAAADGRATEMYAAETFEQQLLEVGPPRQTYKLTWQYPPTVYLLIAPLAFMPYVWGLILWTGGTAAIFLSLLRVIGVPVFWLFVVVASPVTLHSVVTGQNGFLTAALFFTAALYGKDKPIIAGLAAALLTFKPQLGLLIPVAWLAAGYWRAISTAVIGTALFAGLATVVYGMETWVAFFHSAAETSGRVGDGIMPLYKMVTPYAWTKQLTGSSAIAAIFGIGAAMAAITLVFQVWRSSVDAEIKAATLCICSLFAAPYGFYYDLTILVLPMIVLVRYALKDGWLPYEQLIFASLFLLPMSLPGDAAPIGFSTGFPIVLLMAFCLIRRLVSKRSQFPSKNNYLTNG